MNFEPLDTTWVQARVKDNAPTLRLVAGAADYASVKALGDFPAPAAYVLLADETPGTGGPSGARAVPAVAQFGVALALRNYRDRAGDQLSAEARQVIGQVRAALIGWTPPVAGLRATEWAGGGVMDYDAGVLLWVEAFRCTHVLQR